MYKQNMQITTITLTHNATIPYHTYIRTFISNMCKLNSIAKAIETAIHKITIYKSCLVIEI